MNASATARVRKSRSFTQELDFCCLDNYLEKQIKKVILYYRSPEQRFRRRGLLGKIGLKSDYWQEREIEIEGEDIKLELKDGIAHIFFSDRHVYDALTDYDCRSITKTLRVGRHNPYEFKVPVHNVRHIEWE